MRTYHAAAGPFAERPHFNSEEINRICEDALAKEGLLPSAPEPIRIERFIERHFGVTHMYADLGTDVLGYTSFNEKGVAAIYVSRSLDAETTRSAERRITATLAHEAGHGLLHAYLFALQQGNMSLFGEDPDIQPTRMLCRDGEPARRPSRYNGKWWELQANMAIGALLLPHPLIDTAALPFLIEQGHLGTPTLNPALREQALREVADIFNVNPIVVRIRLDGIFPSSGNQPFL